MSIRIRIAFNEDKKIPGLPHNIDGCSGLGPKESLHSWIQRLWRKLCSLLGSLSLQHHRRWGSANLSRLGQRESYFLFYLFLLFSSLNINQGFWNEKRRSVLHWRRRWTEIPFIFIYLFCKLYYLWWKVIIWAKKCMHDASCIEKKRGHFNPTTCSFRRHFFGQLLDSKV